MHRSQVLFALLSAFLAGVFLASLMRISWSLILIFSILGISIIAVAGYEKTFGRFVSKRKKGIVIGFLLLVFALGLGRYSAFEYGHTLLEEFNNRDSEVILRGYISDELENDGAKTKFTFRVKEIQTPQITIPVDENVLIRTDIFPPKAYGDFLEISGVPEKPQNFSNFDYIIYLKKEGIRSIIAFPRIRKIDAVRIGIFEKYKIPVFKMLFSVKNNFQASIKKVMAEPDSEYMNGILLGSRQNIPIEIRESFNKTGTTHVLALSGFNITIIANALLITLTQFKRRKKAFWVSSGIIVLFTIMVGAGPSIARATIMGLILLFAQSYGRLYNPMNAILFAAALMVWLNPLILVHDIGFQLSFMAVMGIIMFHPVFERAMRAWPDKFKIRENLQMTISAQVLVIPLLMYYFQQFSLVSLPANILILPLIPLAMLLGFLSGLAGLIFIPLGKALGILATLVSTYQLTVVEWLGSFEFSSLTISINAYVLFFSYSIIIISFLIMRQKNSHEI